MENFYNNYFIFNTNYINRLLATSFVLIWSVFFIFIRMRTNKNSQSNRLFNQPISPRGIGLGFILVSMLLEIMADIITVKDNSSENLDNFLPQLKFSSLILWNFSLAMKSLAAFIAFTRYFPLTSTLSKEEIMSHQYFNFSVYFNLLSGIMIYPSLVCVLVLYKTTWSQSMLITYFYYMFQMTICLIFFLILNIKMHISIEVGLLYDIHAIKQFRYLISRTYNIIGFLACEILSLFIYNLSQLAGKFIQKSFWATTIIFGFIILSSSAVYVIIVMILSHIQQDNNNSTNLPNGKSHTLSDFTSLNVSEEQKRQSKPPGFSSIRLHGLFKKHNVATPLPTYVKDRGDFVDVELGDSSNEKTSKSGGGTIAESTEQLNN
ncbi:uncharacterized protein OCT59_013099 [Rhizophagus irregularis]|uniref:Uncharacterized protein n=4 Tax=Rhizophagus irregularis TaxID=588596 RepID=A0A015I469_RHIIW|nr:hypothetical protein GLOIN_2v1572731 [Rhizophagus irregularis DAOM 181602=DAOM 197198]EXX51787.1 hypothetical protein RirG_258750 [Rhizophagus irregularis DAOM 197198w]POG74736.1 hypothetical protein GLOIN_2v1572731 [Rhizophagus irregularis DAOM 181602=DAOM 197198]UZO20677.1 hypothetical protein OCT59_013099 [Rhizophagus irregularis]|eukprot:XP_025181602.1 hypothetical protein GLOIN_2v1572731 [Rhizophagus irregularis DAOM 181602=DAOM 197198]